MKTGFKDLDNLIKIDIPQLIVCSSMDYVIEVFLTNILKNISVDQKISALYIDNLIRKDCTKDIIKEREIIFKNKMYGLSTTDMIINVADNTFDDILSSITMINREKILDNRMAEAIFTEEEIKNLSKNDKVDLIEILEGKKYKYECKLLKKEEKNIFITSKLYFQ